MVQNGLFQNSINLCCFATNVFLPKQCCPYRPKYCAEKRFLIHFNNGEFALDDVKKILSSIHILN